MEIFAFYDIALEPIKFQNHSASQNDRLNLSFVKDRYDNAEKSATKGRPVVPGCAGRAMAHPKFGRSVNPISTRGNRLSPPNGNGIYFTQ